MEWLTGLLAVAWMFARILLIGLVIPPLLMAAMIVGNLLDFLGGAVGKKTNFAEEWCTPLWRIMRRG